ncbi:MAG TPA: YhjD/YihY/BrkB family envelope integrity protein, partial [Acidimicrobiia bacterium]|nr:YhjD/YihY/BrkB family envelope integrity protein [Acidimicrobiia bacterium]
LRIRLVAADLSLGAAAVAFRSFLALLPLVLALLGVGALLGGSTGTLDRIGRALDPVAPDAVETFLTGMLTDADRRLDGEWWLITIATLVALFLGSRAVVALQRALAAGPSASGLRSMRSRRPVAIALTVAGGITLLVSGTLIVAGRSLFVFLAGWTGQSMLLDLWRWLRLPLAAAGLFGFILLCYRYGPPRPLPRAVPAAALATAGVLLGSLGFRWYLSIAPRFGAALGTVGAVTALLGWLYVFAWSVLAAPALLATDDSG